MNEFLKVVRERRSANKFINDIKIPKEDFKHDEAIRNASLSAMMFMLLAKNKDWDTCPMIYFDKDRISQLLNIPENEVPVIMITIGKMDKSSSKIRGYRKPAGEFVKFY